MPFIKGFRSTNVWNAFILNSIAASLVIVLAITVKGHFDNYESKTKDNVSNIKRKTTLKSVLITLSVTFCTSMLAYIVMYYTFGYGGGMLINQ